MQQVLAVDVQSLQVAGSLLCALKVQAHLEARAHAEPLQAQRGWQGDADVLRKDCERRQMLQLLSCTSQSC